MMAAVNEAVLFEAVLRLWTSSVNGMVSIVLKFMRNDEETVLYQKSDFGGSHYVEVACPALIGHRDGWESALLKVASSVCRCCPEASYAH